MGSKKDNINQESSTPVKVTAIKLYQIIHEEKNRAFIFEDYECVRQAFKERAPSEIYECVFDGKIDVQSPEDVFRIFNCANPTDYKGRSMSVSDIVVFEYSNGKKTVYFCARFGFKIIGYWKDGHFVLQWQKHEAQRRKRNERIFCETEVSVQVAGFGIYGAPVYFNSYRGILPGRRYDPGDLR